MAIVLLIIFLFTAIFCKLVYLQVVSSEKLQVKALDQWSRDVPITGERGDIFDCNGNILADTATTYTVYVRPVSVVDKGYVAQVLGSVLDLDVQKLYEKINTKVSEVTIAKQVNACDISKIFSTNVTGVYYAQNIERKYIYGDFLSMVLGFTNIDGMGQTGIEGKYNEYLEGKNGMILTETDLVGRELESNVTYYIQGEKGANVYLTIDYGIQSIVQNAVNEAYTAQKAKAASCVMLDPKTGAVLAMAQAPSFDLNNVPRDDLAKLMSLSRNTIVTNVYEPGSTFKVLTASLGLENGYISVDSTRCYCPGYRIVDGKRIKCWRTIGHGIQSFPEAVQNSCNCMFMDIAIGIGKENIGYPVSQVVIDRTNLDYAVIEASSFQLEYAEIHPYISVILNLAPDHMDRYAMYADYVQAKKRVCMFQEEGSFLLFNNDDGVARSFVEKTKAQGVPVSVRKPLSAIYIKDGYFMDEDQSLCSIKCCRLRGEHNKFNLLIALNIGKILGVKKDAMIRLIKEYTLLPNRIEYVTTLNGKKYYNDSKGTNIHACRYAIDSLDGTIGLIMGGSDKNEDFCDFFENLDEKVKHIAITGGNAEKIYNSAMKMGYTSAEILPTLQSAVAYLSRLNDIENILLSPCCASFDRYKNYAERGEKFKETVYAVQK